MSIDPRKLRPHDVVRVLNSTALGEVTTGQRVRRHSLAAGFRISAAGDPDRIDLWRYAAWLASRRRERRRILVGREAAPVVDAYEAQKERARERMRALSASGRNIGPLPDVQDPARRDSCHGDFRLFCERYFPATFALKWSPDHLTVIGKIELCVLSGGLFAMAMPRGSGKSSLCEAAAIWAMVYGHRQFVVLIGADEDAATQMLESIKSEFENNEALGADFPGVCFPIRAMDGIHQRAAGQLYEGKQTHIGWTEKEIVLPTVAGSIASGAVIRVAGITGRVRGMKAKRVDGTTIRPDLALIDDPQTDESARSPGQVATRERVLSGAVLGLAGPGRKIAGLMTCTKVRADDLADRILDREIHPAWQGETTKMVYAFPTNEKKWAEYARLRAEGLAAGRGLDDATEYYRKHRKAMDAGSRVAWNERFNHDELSALQHAMNLRYADEGSFFAEYQNEPLPEIAVDEELMKAEEIAAKLNGHGRFVVPISATRLTMFIDVQQRALFYAVIAWDDEFNGYVVDYGCEPDQRRRPGEYWALRDIKRTLQAAAPGTGVEGAIYAGLESLTEAMLGTEWQREDGAVIRIERCLIDANWGISTDTVYQFSRQSRFASVVTPSHGRYVGAASIPFSDYKRKRGERVGLNWRVPLVIGKRAVRHVVYDTNYWKSFVQSRLRVAMGDAGCLSIYGDVPAHHGLFASHLTSEYRTRTEGRGRVVDEWKLRADGVDNHWLDCVVGAAVAASMQGCTLFGTQVTRERRERIKLSALQKARR